MKKILLLVATLTCSALATAEEPSPARLALAREAIAAMKIDRMFDGMSAQIKQMASQQVQLPVTATEAERANFNAYLGKVTDLTVQEMKTLIGKMDAVYADVYSESELKAIIAFFKSPEGESMQAKQPQVMARVMPLVQEMQQSMMGQIQALVGEYKAPAAEAK